MAYFVVQSENMIFCEDTSTEVLAKVSKLEQQTLKETLRHEKLRNNKRPKASS